MIYGYARCSTNEKLQDIDRQRRELRSLGATDETIYFEYIGGAKKEKPEFDKLMDIVQKGDTITTTEVSRLSRSTRQLCDIIQLIKENCLKLIIKGSITVDCTKNELDPMTNAFLQIAGVFAELERNIISQRVKSGIANAREKGSIIGRPKTSKDNVPQMFLKFYPMYKTGKLNKLNFARICKISYPSVYKYLALIES